MKKILIICIGILLFASTKEEFLEYTNKLVTYHFELKNFDKIKSPFYKPKKKVTFLNKLRKSVKKVVHISLISVFDDRAYLKIEEYKGTDLVKSFKKWVKKGDKIEYCKVVSINIDKVVLKCNGKKLVKTTAKKLLKIRIEK
jgi:hypothetical protein